MYPMMAPEMISARVEELRREGEARGREPRGAPRGLRLGLRAALGGPPGLAGLPPAPRAHADPTDRGRVRAVGWLGYAAGPSRTFASIDP